MDKPGLTAARRNYKRLSREEQFAVARSVVETRWHELVLAYKNVERVAFGYKTRGGDARGQDRELLRTPCVIFVVARKWKSEGRASDPQKLPSYLLATWAINGKPALCAVPTDVRAQSYYGKPVPMAAAVPQRFGIVVQRPNHVDVMGCVACLVRRPSFPGVEYMLSCRHVFTRTEEDVNYIHQGLHVVAGSSGNKAGATVPVRGELQPLPNWSFDAQLAEASSRSALAQALQGTSFDANPPSANLGDALDNAAYIATPRDVGGKRLVIKVTPEEVILHNVSLPYVLLGRAEEVQHSTLVAAKMTAQGLDFGDSGSPVMSSASGGRLLGMFIGASNTVAYYIPAWELLDPGSYGRVEKPWQLA